MNKIANSISDMSNKTLVFVLTTQPVNLKYLTQHRQSADLPVLGNFKVIDFVLSNCVNSSLKKIIVLVHFDFYPLTKHMQKTWQKLNNNQFAEYCLLKNIQDEKKLQHYWTLGSTDLLVDNLHTIKQEAIEYILLLNTRAIYSLNYDSFLNQYSDSLADISIGVIEVPIENAGKNTIVVIDKNDRVVVLTNKNNDINFISSRPGYCLLYTGILLVNKSLLINTLEAIKANPPAFAPDFELHILPELIKTNDTSIHHCFSNTHAEKDKPQNHWHTFNTLDEYWQLHMHAIEEKKALSSMASSEKQPIMGDIESLPVYSENKNLPASYFSDVQISHAIINNGGNFSNSVINNSMVSESVSVTDSSIDHCVINAKVELNNCKIKNAIIDEDCILNGMDIGHDLEKDKYLFEISDNGIVLVTKGLLQMAGLMPKVI